MNGIISEMLPMKNRRRTYIWCAIIPGTLAIILTAFFVFGNLYLNSASTKNKLQAVAAEKLGGKVSYERVDISLFPQPHVVIKKLHLAYPRTLRGTVQSLNIYPQILPLFKGKLLYSKIRILGPDFRIILPAPKSEATSEVPSIEEMKSNIRSLLGYLEAIGAGLIVDMDQGNFIFRRNRRDFLVLRNVAVHFNAPPGAMKIVVKASTEQWGDFSLSGTYSFSETKSEVREFAVSLGRSSLSGFSANLLWDGTPRLEILSGRSTVALDEIYSWLSSSKSLTPFLKNVRLRHGVLSISTLQISGPIDKPDAWERKVEGELRGVVAESVLLPDPLNVSSRFLIKGNTLAVSGLSARIGASSLEGISARFVEGKTPFFEVFRGRAQIILSEVFKWQNKYKALADLLNEVKELSGTVTLSSMRMSGPVLRPAAWRLKIIGKTKNIVVNSPLLPSPLAVNGKFIAEADAIAVYDASLRLGTSSLTHVTASVTGREKPFVEVFDAEASINLGEFFKWRSQFNALDTILHTVANLDGTLTVSSTNFRGPLFQPKAWKISASGNLDHIVFNSSFLPGQIGLVKGNFSLIPDKLSFALQQATILDSTVTGTAVMSGITSTLRSVDMTLSGKSGSKMLDWVFQQLELPPSLMIKAPLTLTDSHLVWGNTSGVSFKGMASVANGPALFVDLSQHGADFTIHRLIITDQETKASFTLNWQKKAADFSFSGHLAQATLSRIFEQGTFGNGIMRGDLHGIIRTDQPLRSRIKGSMAGNDIFIPWGMSVPTIVEKFSLHAEDDVLTIESADVTWGKNHYSMEGAATTSDEGIAFSMALNSDGIEIQAIQQALRQASKKSSGQKVRSFPIPPIRGDLRANSKYVKFGRFTFAPAHAIITVAPEKVNMEFFDTKTCGISLPGSILISRESISFVFNPAAKKETLGPTVDCLAGKKIDITGDYGLNAHIQGQGTSDQLLSSLEGRIDFTAKNGKIYRYPTLQKIFSVLSVLEIFRGRTPEIGGSGFPYHSMAVRGDIHKGVFTIEKAYIGGQSLDIIATGEVDLGKQQVDLIVLAAPFSTLNWLIRNTPIIGKIMGGTLISVPVHVTGALGNPDVIFLSPTAVGSRILNILENIIKLPVDIISPLLQKETGQDSETK
jgi:hypothetical protein